MGFVPREATPGGKSGCMKCLRCGKEFENPMPEITVSDGYKEIASVLYCASCNAFVMSVLFRDRSAYDIFKDKRKPTE